MKPKTLSLIASISLLAPDRPVPRLGGVCPCAGRLVDDLKVIPLMFALFGILRGTRYTYQWSCDVILLYLTEGVVRTNDAAPATYWRWRRPSERDLLRGDGALRPQHRPRAWPGLAGRSLNRLSPGLNASQPADSAFGARLELVEGR